ncbi:helix-turn-helix transcriptional regulator [Exilibacterium tricleocarpae]|uniref:Helix-turn-helix transcriptional regulator n=2 Tax=Exilibacterium tricleocarpae TaxID=2591008 RepID=A0A545SMG7_9GAMM|nr:helix-turn-helix transcriptional regulator [Exilibacterium tricleocarpae]
MPKHLDCLKFGQMVRELREKKGFSQEVFADQAGVHRTYMGGIERGERNPTLTTIWKIARALNISPAAFFELTDHAKDLKSLANLEGE